FDVLLAARLLHVPHRQDDVVELLLRRHLVRVSTSRARDRLEDHGEPDLLDGRPNFALAAHTLRLWNAKAGGFHALLHDLLVAKAAHVVDAHAGHAEFLAHPRRQDRERLPIREHAIDALAAKPIGDARDDVVLVHDAR